MRAGHRRARAGGIHDVLHDGENGLLFPPADEAACETAIETLLGDAALRARLGQSAALPSNSTTVQGAAAANLEVYSALTEAGQTSNVKP